MKSHALTLVVAAALVAPPLSAADAIEGTLLAYDRVANVLVLSDKSVWTLENLEQPLPENLVAGERVEIRYESNEDDGLAVIHSVERLP